MSKSPVMYHCVLLLSLYQVVGGNEDNLILTRRVQRDLWVHQHPRDCSAPGVKFLLVNITHDVQVVNATKRRTIFLGVGAQIMVAAGFMSRAVKMGRVLVIDNYHRATHSSCTGKDFPVPHSSCTGKRFLSRAGGAERRSTQLAACTSHKPRVV